MQSSASETPPTDQVDGAEGGPHTGATIPQGREQNTEHSTPQAKDGGTPKDPSRRLLERLGWTLLTLAALACAIRMIITAFNRKRMHIAEAFVWFLVQFLSLFVPLARFILIGVRVSERNASERRIIFLQSVAILALMTGLGIPLAVLWFDKARVQGYGY